MPTIEFNKRSRDTTKLRVQTDYAPWQNWAPTFVGLNRGRVISVSEGIGANITEATIELLDRSFGSFSYFHHPVKIISTKELANGTTRATTIFRGFVTRPSGTLNESEDKLIVVAKDYKWYLKKITKIRGRWYTTGGSSATPSFLGSPFTAGNGRFTFEKFRANIANNAGFLQNEECVFNRDGYPDCATNTIGVWQKCIFYPGKATRNEENGLTDTTWRGVQYDGKYWTFRTVLKHIEKYWIDPYFGFLVDFRISGRSYTEIERLENKHIFPINLSIEGQDPLSAIDTIVKSMPGRWIWWVKYNGSYIEIEIRNINTLAKKKKNVIIGDNTKLATMNPMANVHGANISRDATDAIRYAIAKGGTVKLITTLKLIPMWPRYLVDGQYRDFKNRLDFAAWKRWLRSSESSVINDSLEDMTQEQRERYPLIYRRYGVAKGGNYLARSVTNTTSSILPELNLDGVIGTEYAAFQDDILKMFFKGVKVIRRVEPPVFDRYSDKVVVFLKDELRGTEVKQQGYSYTLNTRISNNLPWIDTNHEKVGFDLDEVNVILNFREPQFMRKQMGKGNNKTISNLSILSDGDNWKDLRSRKVFMTCTICTDVAAILGRKRSRSFINIHHGSDFSEYVDVNGADIIIHKNAWYPINAGKKTVTTETDSTSTADGTAIGTKLRKCSSFRNYQKYVGQGAQQLVIALTNLLSTRSDFVEEGTVDLGYHSIFYRLGDYIKDVTNSEKSIKDASAGAIRRQRGYLNLRCFVTVINHVAEGDSDVYTTNLTVTNDIGKPTNSGNIKFPRKKLRELFQIGAELDFDPVKELNMADWTQIEGEL